MAHTGKCKVDETEKGWWITLIQKDPMEVRARATCGTWDGLGMHHMDARTTRSTQVSKEDAQPKCMASAQRHCPYAQVCVYVCV